MTAGGVGGGPPLHPFFGPLGFGLVSGHELLGFVAAPLTQRNPAFELFQFSFVGVENPTSPNGLSMARTHPHRTQSFSFFTGILTALPARPQSTAVVGPVPLCPRGRPPHAETACEPHRL